MVASDAAVPIHQQLKWVALAGLLGFVVCSILRLFSFRAALLPLAPYFHGAFRERLPGAASEAVLLPLVGQSRLVGRPGAAPRLLEVKADRILQASVRSSRDGADALLRSPPPAMLTSPT
jgi:hypothetical protein